MNELVLKDFSGQIEVTPTALKLKQEALAAARPIARVETPEQQVTAVAALKLLKELRGGMETTRQAVKRPVLDLGRKIDNIARGFMEDVEKQYGRLSGLINHYQRKVARVQHEEADKIASKETLATQLRDKASILRQQALVADKPSKAKAFNDEAARIEHEAFDLEMQTELAVVPGIEKPKGLVVRNKINFQVTDAIVVAQAFPQFWKWHPETETLKLDRMRILDELNKEGGGFFHETRFPEELSQTEDRRLVQPAGLRVFEETKTHIR